MEHTSTIPLADAKVILHKSQLLFSEMTKQLTGKESSNQPMKELIRLHLQELEENEPKLSLSEFFPTQTWFNTSRPLNGSDLESKIILAHFFRYNCINCLHNLADLDYLLHKFTADRMFEVIGIHSAKFGSERQDLNVQQAIKKHNIKHPVINVQDLYHWKKLNIQSWPTMAVLGPNGKVIFMLAGEGHRMILEHFIGEALLFYREKGLLKSTSLPIKLEVDKVPIVSSLKFPGKIAVLSKLDRLVIADTGNHRVIVTTLAGKLVHVIGTGLPGFQDGAFDKCSFNQPNGIAIIENPLRLLIADSHNHAIRLVSLAETLEVKTIAGTGKQGDDLVGGAVGKNQSLNTPWDVALQKSTDDGDNNSILYVAMAGTHQLWEHNVRTGVTRRLVGNGMEGNRNSSDPNNATFAQLTGLSLPQNSTTLYVVDSESSSIRSIRLDTLESSPIAGGSVTDADNLFIFGDVDGKGDAARLQHPSAVLYVSAEIWTGVSNPKATDKDGVLVIADTLNNKIKFIKLATNECRSWIGDGHSGLLDGEADEARFFEPCGLGLDEIGRRIFVADTNNHAIRIIHLEDVGRVSTLDLSNIPSTVVQEVKPAVKKQRRLVKEHSPRLQAGLITNQVNASGIINLELNLGSSHYFTAFAPSRYQVFQKETPSVQFEKPTGNIIDWPDDGDENLHIHHTQLTLPFQVTNPPTTDNQVCELELAIYKCSLVDGVCSVDNLILEVFLDGSGKAQLNVQLDLVNGVFTIRTGTTI